MLSNDKCFLFSWVKGLSGFLVDLERKDFFTLIMVIMFISKDTERQTEGLGSGQKKLPHSSSSHPEDTSDSADEMKHVSYALYMLVNTLLDSNAHIYLFITHTWVSFSLYQPHCVHPGILFIFLLKQTRLMFRFLFIDWEDFYPNHKCGQSKLRAVK